jgi:hypothetical protein
MEGVCFGGFVSVMLGVQMVSVGDVRVMRGLFVSAGIVVFRCFLVMTGRVFVMLRRLPMMFAEFLRHWGMPLVEVCQSRNYGLETSRKSLVTIEPEQVFRIGHPSGTSSRCERGAVRLISFSAVASAT